MGLHERVFISNRGEIASRIARAASALGMESVSIYAPVDSLSLHTRTSTASQEIGEASQDPIEAYLDVEALVALAKDANCDCVHPGYGFLSENSQFAESLEEAGIQLWDLRRRHSLYLETKCGRESWPNR